MFITSNSVRKDISNEGWYLILPYRKRNKSCSVWCVQSIPVNPSQFESIWVDSSQFESIQANSILFITIYATIRTVLNMIQQQQLSSCLDLANKICEVKNCIKMVELYKHTVVVFFQNFYCVLLKSVFLRNYLTKSIHPKKCKNGPPTQQRIDGAIFAFFWMNWFCQVVS